MELILALMCDDASTTSDGKLDVHGVFNDLFAPGFPARRDKMVLVAGIEWDREDADPITLAAAARSRTPGPPINTTR